MVVSLNFNGIEFKRRNTNLNMLTVFPGECPPGVQLIKPQVRVSLSDVMWWMGWSEWICFCTRTELHTSVTQHLVSKNPQRRVIAGVWPGERTSDSWFDDHFKQIPIICFSLKIQTIQPLHTLTLRSHVVPVGTLVLNYEAPKMVLSPYFQCDHQTVKVFWNYRIGSGETK